MCIFNEANLHDKSCLKPLGSQCPRHAWKCSKRNCVRALTMILMREIGKRDKDSPKNLSLLWWRPEAFLLYKCIKFDGDLNLKMGRGIPKLMGLFNAPICAYLIRQSNQLVTDIRTVNFIATFGNDLRKIRRKLLTRLTPDRPLGRRQYPSPLRAGW